MSELNHKNTKKKRVRRFGDRKEGRKLRSLAPMTYVFPHIIPKRSGCVNLFKDSLDTQIIDEYIREKHEQGLKGFGFLHVFVAGYVRTLAARPGLNRFIAKEKLYSRYDIDIMMMIKKEMSLSGEEVCVKITPKPDFTANQVYELLDGMINENRKSEGDSSFENAARILSHIPGVIMKIAVKILRLMDRWDLIPRSLLRASPFHGSMFLTSMGSLGIPPVYHHLYDFGNVPIFMSYGSKRRANVISNDGTVVRKTFIDYTVTTDDRTCDGYYYASALKLFKKLMKNPWLLDEPPKEVLEDVD